MTTNISFIHTTLAIQALPPLDSPNRSISFEVRVVYFHFFGSFYLFICCFFLLALCVPLSLNNFLLVVFNFEILIKIFLHPLRKLFNAFIVADFQIEHDSFWLLLLGNGFASKNLIEFWILTHKLNSSQFIIQNLSAKSWWVKQISVRHLSVLFI